MVVGIMIAIDDLKYAGKKDEVVYIFDNEPLEKLIDSGFHCMHKDYVNFVDVNTTKYDIECIKKCKITDDLTIKENDYKFAIIIPNYNNAHGDYKNKTYLENCLESILNQSYQNFKIIFVDDLSTDESVKIARSYQKKYVGKIEIIENKRKRYNGGSRNVGIEYALSNFDFDYFCFLDSDDWWKDKTVLDTINKCLNDHDMLIMGLELIDKNGVFATKINEFDNFSDFFFSDQKTWCTAWARVIKKEKIVYFCEDTLMEDRVWSYRQADNVDFKKVRNLKKVCYVWNRMNTDTSVSLTRGDFWNASTYCHIGHQLQLLSQLKHKEVAEQLKARIEKCKDNVRYGIYDQY